MPVLLIVGVCYEVLCPALFTYKILLVSDKSLKVYKSVSQSQYLCG